MALHDPVEDALNERKRKARLIEAGAAVGSPDALDITRKFLAGGQQLPSQAASIARQRAFGQQGAGRRRGGRTPFLYLGGYEGPNAANAKVERDSTFARTQQGQDIFRRGGGGLSDSLVSRFLDLPGPGGFAKTPQGQAILQRIIGRGDFQGGDPQRMIEPSRFYADPQRILGRRGDFRR